VNPVDTKMMAMLPTRSVTKPESDYSFGSPDCALDSIIIVTTAVRVFSALKGCSQRGLWLFLFPMAPKTKSEFSGKDDGLLQAVIIADSFDCSFSPLSVSTPRCLFPLANRPLIDYALTVLKTSGVVHEVFVYCTAHAIQIR
jgi:hypothetical protein